MMEELAFAAEELEVPVEDLPDDVTREIRRRYLISVGVPVEATTDDTDRDSSPA